MGPHELPNRLGSSKRFKDLIQTPGLSGKEGFEFECAVIPGAAPLHTSDYDQNIYCVSKK